MIKANPHYEEFDDYGSDGIPYELLTSPEIVLKLPYVYACLDVIGTAISNTAFRAYREYQEPNPHNALKNHSLIEKLKNPNELMTGGQLFEGTEWWRLIHGNAYWLLDEIDGHGRPERIYLLDPRRVRVAVSKSEVIGYVFEGYNGELIRLSPEEVIHFKKVNPFHPIYGMGVLQAGALHFDTELSREKYDNSFFKRGAKPGAVLETEKVLDDNEFNRIKREWRKMYEGEKNTHRTAILEGGFTFKPVSFNHQQIEKVAGDKFGRDKTLAMFNVPPSAVQVYENANLSTAWEMEYTFMSKTIAPKLKYYEDMINKHLAPRYRPKSVFLFDNVIPKNQEMLNQRIEVLSASGAATVNDIRLMAGLPPLPGGIGDQLIRPPGSPMQSPAGSSPAADKPSEQESKPEQSETEAEETEQEKRQKSMPVYQYRGKQLTADDMADRHDLWVEEFVETHLPKLEKFFQDQFSRVSARIFGRGKTFKAYNFEATDAWNDEQEKSALEEILLYLYLVSGMRGYQQMNELLNGDLVWDIENPYFRTAKDAIRQMIEGINETSRERVLAVIREGMRRGYSVRQIINGYPRENYPGLKGVFDDFINKRAETILIDAAVVPYNLFGLTALQELGVKRVFVTDGREYDEPCRMADGSVWTVEKAIRNYQEHPRCKRKFWPIPSTRGDENATNENETG